jgi:Ca2+-binding RTX toxin-like protein
VPRPLALLAVLVGALALAAPASGAISPSVGPGNSVSIVSDGAGDTITVRCEAGEGMVGPYSLPPCDEITVIQVEAGGGNDAIDLSAVTPAEFPLLTRTILRGDAGTDTITGSQGDDEIKSDELDSVDGAGGDDRIEQGKQVIGGPGDDLLLASAGTADGGAGDDVFFEPGSNAKSLSGGAGYDTISFDFGSLTSQAFPLELALNDSEFRLHVIGLPSEATLSINSLEHVAMILLNGPQSVEAAGYSGALDVDGRGGADTLTGGSGANALHGGAGDDVLTGGPSSDLLDGGGGNDQLRSRDGRIDVDECGEGTDTATADAIDSATGCESLLVPDATPPETRGLKGPSSVVKGKKATFKFSSSEAGSTFRCRVDKGKAVRCASPYKLKTAKLKAGKHTLSVFAVDAAGNADATPATLRFTVVAPKKTHEHSGR